MSDNYLNVIRKVTQRNPRRFNPDNRDNKMEAYVSSSTNIIGSNNNDIYKGNMNKNETSSSDESEIENQEPKHHTSDPSSMFILLKDLPVRSNSPIRAPKIFDDDDDDDIMESKDEDVEENTIKSPLASKSTNIIHTMDTGKIEPAKNEIKKDENHETKKFESKEENSHHEKPFTSNNYSPNGLNVRSPLRLSRDVPSYNMTPKKSPILGKIPTHSSVYSPKKPSSLLQSFRNISANFNSSLLFISVFLLLVVVSFNGWFNTVARSDTSLNSKATQNYLKKELQENLASLKSKYPNQTSSFWANVESTFVHSIINSKDPSIILIVNDETTSELAAKVTNDLFQSFLNILSKNSKRRDFFVDPQDDGELAKLINNDEFDLVKSYVDKKLDNIFSSGNKLALVRNIEQLPPTTMLLFYTYGDDLANAKYPGVVIFMSLKLKNIFMEKQNRNDLLKSSSKLNEFVENYLYDLWSNKIGDDQLRPLFTRIANNVIFVNEE